MAGPWPSCSLHPVGLNTKVRGKMCVQPKFWRSRPWEMRNCCETWTEGQRKQDENENAKLLQRQTGTYVATVTNSQLFIFIQSIYRFRRKWSRYSDALFTFSLSKWRWLRSLPVYVGYLDISAENGWHRNGYFLECKQGNEVDKKLYPNAKWGISEYGALKSVRTNCWICCWITLIFVSCAWDGLFRAYCI